MDERFVVSDKSTRIPGAWTVYDRKEHREVFWGPTEEDADESAEALNNLLPGIGI